MVLQLVTCCPQQILLLENVLVKVVALHTGSSALRVDLPRQVQANFVFHSVARLVGRVLYHMISNWTVRNKSGTYSCPDKHGARLQKLYEKSGQSRKIRDGW